MSACCFVISPSAFAVKQVIPCLAQASLKELSCVAKYAPPSVCIERPIFSSFTSFFVSAEEEVPPDGVSAGFSPVETAPAQPNKDVPIMQAASSTPATFFLFFITTILPIK